MENISAHSLLRDANTRKLGEEWGKVHIKIQKDLSASIAESSQEKKDELKSGPWSDFPAMCLFLVLDCFVMLGLCSDAAHRRRGRS
jgi:hypothetical protein